MAKKRGDEFTVYCPLGCGADITDLQDEHACGEEMTEDPEHEHAFGTSGTCACGITVQRAIELAAEASLDPSLPAASVACKRCEAPITQEERRTSGTCGSCLAEDALHTSRPTRVAVAPQVEDEEGDAGDDAVAAPHYTDEETDAIIERAKALIARGPMIVEA